MEQVNLTTLFSVPEIHQRVTELGEHISEHYKKLLAKDDMLVVVGVLNGAFVFMADLIRAIKVPLEVDFIRLSSYQDSKSSSNKVIMLKDLEREIKNRHVLVVEDIVDCGLTLAWLLEHLRKRQPKSVKLAVAVDKKARREVAGLTLDYVGFTVDDGFLVGYGLDAARKFREIPSICAIKER
jgi:hypoxanthine phosphoribosyltransferase